MINWIENLVPLIASLLGLITAIGSCIYRHSILKKIEEYEKKETEKEVNDSINVLDKVGTSENDVEKDVNGGDILPFSIEEILSENANGLKEDNSDILNSLYTCYGVNLIKTPIGECEIKVIIDSPSSEVCEKTKKIESLPHEESEDLDGLIKSLSRQSSNYRVVCGAPRAKRDDFFRHNTCARKKSRKVR